MQFELHSFVVAPLAAAALTMALTGLVRRHAVARQQLDHPNERSSHTTPTPRGGGLAVVVVVTAYLAWAGAVGRIPSSTAIGLIGGGLLVAVAGWLDDRKSLAAHPRLAMQLLAAVWALGWIGGFPSLTIDDTAIPLGLFGTALGVLGLLWATNLFNFMDGIDGIAAVEGISVGAAGGLFLLMNGAPGLGVLNLVIAASLVGFAYWNWDPARIFLGDVGSGFLGFMFAGIAIASENGKFVPVLVWSILAAVFIVDATVTVLRRFRRGLWRDAHRSHAYQRAVQGGLSHGQVSIAVGVLNLVLAAIAAAAVAGLLRLSVAVTAAFGIVGLIFVAVERRWPMRTESATQN